MKQTMPQTILGGTDYSGIPGSELTRVIITDSPDRAAAKRRQELRRSNAAVPIPSGQYKTPRSMVKQSLREDIR